MKQLNKIKKTKIPLSIKLSYGVGNIGLVSLIAAMSFFLMIFYTDVALISPAIAGMALTVGKIWDIINDPIFGWMTDRTKSKHGRRRVYLIYGAVPLVIASFILWMVPSGLSNMAAFIWIAVTYIIFSTVFSITYIPYTAMAAELTKDYDERTSLMTVSSIGAVLGYIVGSISVRLIVGNAVTPQIGYMIVGGVFGILAGLSVAFVAWRVKEPTDFKNVTSKMPLITSIKTTFKNKPFVMLVAAFGLVRLAFTLMSAVMMYFVVYNLVESRDSIGKILTILMLVIAAFIMLWKWVGNRWSKSISYVGGLIIVAICAMASFWLGKGDMNMMSLLAGALGIGMASHWIMPFAMMPDVIEYDQMRTGERREGIFFGVYGLVDKIARTLGIIILGWVLEIFNYVPNVEQTAESLLGIRLLFGPVPAALILLAIPILIFYPINRESHAAMVDSLEKGEIFSEEEIEEYWKKTA